MNLKKILAAAAFAMASVFTVAPAQSAPTVGLYLSMDGSGSINSTQFTQQINGYIAALNAVIPSYYGQVAIGGNIFGFNVAQFFAVTTINNATDLGSLTSAISALNPGRGGIATGATAIGDAVTAATNALLGFETSLGSNLRLVIDVTTDGSNNAGLSPITAANNATAAGIDAVNCLGIGTGASCAWVGANGIDFGTVSFANLEEALSNKLRTEIGLVPEPGTLALLGLGLAGLGVLRRRKLQA